MFDYWQSLLRYGSLVYQSSHILAFPRLPVPDCRSTFLTLKATLIPSPFVACRIVGATFLRISRTSIHRDIHKRPRDSRFFFPVATLPFLPPLHAVPFFTNPQPPMGDSIQAPTVRSIGEHAERLMKVRSLASSKNFVLQHFEKRRNEKSYFTVTS